MRIEKVYTKDELLAMPLLALRHLDIDTIQQQELVQQVVNEKLSKLPIQRPVFRRDIPEIKNQEEEAKWQDIINQRERIIRGEDVAPVGDPVNEPAPAPESAPESAPEPTPAETPSVAPENTPVSEPAPTAPEFTPEAAPLAEPTGEGQPVSFAKGVATQLQSNIKIDKRTKAYKASLK